jgi:RHS repeat-associated protein
MYSDSETGLYYWGSRYYDPKTGRSITPDRMSVAEHVRRWQANQNRLNRPPLEINPYVYVANNPLRWTDRTGRVIETWEPSDSITHDPIGWGLPPGPFGPVCGSGTSAAWIPDGPWKDACQKHDECYSRCGASRFQCDIDFFFDSGNAAYFIGVTVGGRQPFQEAQKESCCSQDNQSNQGGTQ